MKQLPVEADVPEFLVKRGLEPDARELDHAIGDLTMIAFYYLLRIGEYTTKGARNNSKQTEEFKLGDITFFSKDSRGQLRCLPRDAPGDLILAAEGATMKLRSGGANALALSGYSDTQIQKMGRWRGATFKEYVRNKLACFSSGMSRDMKTKFGFVNVSGNAFSDITDACINADYSAPLTVAVM